MKNFTFQVIFLMLIANTVFAFEPYADKSGKNSENFSITTTNGRGQEYNAEVVDPQGQSLEVDVQDYHQGSNSSTNTNYSNPQPGQMGQPILR